MRLLLFVILLLIFLVAIMFVIWETMKHRIRLQDQKWQEAKKTKELECEIKFLKQAIEHEENRINLLGERAVEEKALEKIKEIQREIIKLEKEKENIIND